MLSSKDIKRELSRKVDIVRQPEFVGTYIQPCLPEAAGSNGATQSRVIQLDGTGAATIEFTFAGQLRLFAKLYPNDGGPAIYEKLKTLRATGFGQGSPFQVVEPLGFIPEYQMLLARGAEGPAVSTWIDGDDEALLAGVKAAASWLAHLHSTPLRIGTPWSLLVSGELLSLSRRLSKVIAQRPSHLPLALEMIKTLEALSERTADGILAQSHGQYRPIHAFISDDAVTVIDLDRSRPCDPARDVAEFVHRLRMTMFSHRGAVAPADVPTQAFLDTYASVVRDRANLTNLQFHWARYIFHSLNNKLKGEGEGGSELDEVVAFYRSEFENTVKGRFGI